MKKKLFECVGGNQFKLSSKSLNESTIKFQRYDSDISDIPLDIPGLPSENGWEINFEIDTGHCEPHDPGRYSGPPEHCYPASGGEIEMGELRIISIGNEDDGKDYQFAQLNPQQQAVVKSAVEKYTTTNNFINLWQDAAEKQLRSDGEP